MNEDLDTPTRVGVKVQEGTIQILTVLGSNIRLYEVLSLLNNNFFYWIDSFFLKMYPLNSGLPFQTEERIGEK